MNIDQNFEYREFSYSWYFEATQNDPVQAAYLFAANINLRRGFVRAI
jgi:hypothetical protein